MAKVGHDIELAVQINGDLVPACALPEEILGDKGEPLDIGQGVGVLVDGVSIELNQAPFDNAANLTNGIKAAIKHAQTYLKKSLKINDINLLLGGSYLYDNDQLEGFPRAFESGCDPDFNAYTMEKNPRHTFKDSRRYFAGHLHVSYDTLEQVPAHMAIALLELFAYPTLIQSDSQEHRRGLYGKAGCFRPKPYGAEWRMPSNIWAEKSKVNTNFIEHVFDVVNFIEKAPKQALATYLAIPKNALSNAIDSRDIRSLEDIRQHILHSNLGFRYNITNSSREFTPQRDLTSTTMDNTTRRSRQDISPEEYRRRVSVFLNEGDNPLPTELPAFVGTEEEEDEF